MLIWNDVLLRWMHNTAHLEAHLKAWGKLGGWIDLEKMAIQVSCRPLLRFTESPKIPSERQNPQKIAPAAQKKTTRYAR